LRAKAPASAGRWVVSFPFRDTLRRMDFRSDNTHGCSPEIVEALARAAHGSVSSYGSDPYTDRLRERCRELFERDVDIFPVMTGTAGNALAIASLTPPWGTVFCTPEAHIHRDELGAAEFFSGGCTVIPTDDLASAIPLAAVPACVSATNATESGVVLDPAAVAELSMHRLRVHIDGARFANAVAASGASPADLTWRAGVDVLVFGGTKNGCMGVELIVLFRRELAQELTYRWHRAGHRVSKMRFLSAQFEAYLTDDLWLRNARHANAMAARLAGGLRGVAGVEIVREVQANIVFVRVAPRLRALFANAGYDWPLFGDDVYRLVTGFGTTEGEVDQFLAAIPSS
jgi:threonine aldolase